MPYYSSLVELQPKGLVFVINPRLADHVTFYKYISDRVATMDLQIPSCFGSTIDALLDFFSANGYFATNTPFQHPVNIVPPGPVI